MVIFQEQDNGIMSNVVVRGAVLDAVAFSNHGKLNSTYGVVENDLVQL